MNDFHKLSTIWPKTTAIVVMLLISFLIKISSLIRPSLKLTLLPFSLNKNSERKSIVALTNETFLFFIKRRIEWNSNSWEFPSVTHPISWNANSCWLRAEKKFLPKNEFAYAWYDANCSICLLVCELWEKRPNALVRFSQTIWFFDCFTSCELLCTDARNMLHFLGWIVACAQAKKVQHKIDPYFSITCEFSHLLTLAHSLGLWPISNRNHWVPIIIFWHMKRFIYQNNLEIGSNALDALDRRLKWTKHGNMALLASVPLFFLVHISLDRYQISP